MDTSRPPRFAQWLLRHSTSLHIRDRVLGDFEQLFGEIAKREDGSTARRWYWGQVLRSLPYFLHDSWHWSLDMLRNYWNIALRNLKRQRAFTLINVSGLALGFGVCLVTLLYLQDEWSYDRFHEAADRIYRVTETRTSEEGARHIASTQFPIAPLVQAEFPSVVAATRLHRPQPKLVTYGDRQFVEPNVLLADSSVFDVFSFTFLAGTPETALREPEGLVLSASAAEKYFGTENPVGKTLTMENRIPFMVTGVVADVPAQSHFTFDFLGRYEPLYGADLGFIRDNWSWSGFHTYVRLNEPQQARVLDDQFAAFVTRYFPERTQAQAALQLQPLTDIHLQSDLLNELEANGTGSQLYVFALIALLILAVACVNFMTLSTAQSARRMKEVGVRKVLGAYRRSLIGQFLVEAVLMSLLALGLALLLVALALPTVNALTDKTLTLFSLNTPLLWGSALVLVVGVGLLAGSYPAFFFSALRPVRVLKGLLPGFSQGQTRLRKALVVGQFAVSSVLLIGLGTMIQQLDFLRSKDLGFDQEHVVVVASTQEMNRQYDAFRQGALALEGVQQVAMTYGTLPGHGGFSLRARRPDQPAEAEQAVAFLYTDYDFQEALRLDVIDGRFFSHDFPSDSTEALVLNEAAVRLFGFEASPVGEELEYFGGGTDQIEKQGRVVGVVKDFNYASLYSPVEPLVMTLPIAGVAGWPGVEFVVRLAPGDVTETLSSLEAQWKALAPAWPFRATFLDEAVGQQYARDTRLGTLLGFITGVALFIACLGLFGLSLFLTERRTKEVGIRKVMGASLAQVVVLLTRDFVRLVAVAFVVAVPVAYLLMRSWLSTFAYHVDLGPGLFLVAGVSVLGIAVATVGLQAIKGARAHPIEAIRYE